MILNSITKYKLLSKEVKAIVGAFFVYTLAEYAVRVFMGIFVYTQTNSMSFMALYLFIYFTSCMIGFAIFGYFASVFKWNLKWNHLRSFLMYIFAFIWLWFFKEANWHFLIFAIFNGLGLGLFWLGHHSFEIVHTHDKERDFYSALLGVADKSSAIFGPLIAVITFFLSFKIFGNDLSLVLFVMPFLYLLIIPFIANLPNYIPAKISKNKFTQLSSSPRSAKKFAIVESLAWGPWEMVVPLIAVTALQTYMNVGIFDTVIALSTILLLIVQGKFQNIGNRWKVYKITFALLLLYVFGIYFWTLSPWIYIFLGFYWVFVYAIHGTVLHIASLKNIEEFKCNEGCFYLGLLYREFLIWVGRSISLIIMFSASLLIQNHVHITYVAISFLVIQYALLFGCVRGLLKE